jgi:hypothetical protein
MRGSHGLGGSVLLVVDGVEVRDFERNPDGSSLAT